jgi:tRNA/rRNA methyltransferase
MTGAGTDRSRPIISGGPAIILVRPQLAVNIGMCARAMGNFGLVDLRLVNPRTGWPLDEVWGKTADAAAAGAQHLLESARIFDSIPAAVADLHFLWATTARERGQGKRVISPAEAMMEAFPRISAGQKEGILFGPERTGLANDEVGLADAILTFPVNPAYASLNLAQAVLLTGYEWFRAAHGDALPFAETERSPPAPREMVLSFFDYFEEALEKNGFFRPVGKRPIMQRNLRNMFHRMSLTEQDVRTLRGAIVRLVEGPRAEPKTRRRQRRRAAAAVSSDEGGPDGTGSA